MDSFFWILKEIELIGPIVVYVFAIGINIHTRRGSYGPRDEAADKILLDFGPLLAILVNYGPFF